MKEIIISNLDAGQRLDRYLDRYFPEASKSFIYKMLRKKNITLNKKKADGSEKINQGDAIQVFFSDETFEKFSTSSTAQKKTATSSVKQTRTRVSLDIVHEDADMIFINKPEGMLSQKAKPDDVSLVEYLIDYLLEQGSVTESDLRTFHPGICNRLDRNTSGIVAAGKTLKGLQDLSLYFKDRSLNKYYICMVDGVIKKRQKINGYLLKNEKNNKVTIYSKKDGEAIPSALPIETEYIPVADNGKITLLNVHLLTGRSYQIRAHLSSIGHPLIGDFKYGNHQKNDAYTKKYQIQNQMLHAYELDIPQKEIHIYTSIPKIFEKVLKGENIWEPGIPEALEDLH